MDKLNTTQCKTTHCIALAKTTCQVHGTYTVFSEEQKPGFHDLQMPEIKNN